MGSSAPAVRAAGVAILAALAEPAPGLAAGLLPRLRELAADPWWQVRAGLVQVCAGLLRALEGAQRGADAPGNDATLAATAGALDLLKSIVSVETSPAISRIFVAHGAGLLGSHSRELATAFVRQVTALPPDAREHLLGVTARGRLVTPTPDVLPLAGPSALRYELSPIGRTLAYAPILTALAQDVSGRQLDKLEVGHVQLILACVASVMGGDGAGSSGNVALPPEFNTVTGALRQHVIVGLCDPATCHAAVALLQHLVQRSPPAEGLAILGSPTLQVSLQLLHQPGAGGASDRGLQDTVAGLLAELARANRPAGAHKAVSELLRVWAQRYPSLYAESPLRRVSEQMQQ